MEEQAKYFNFPISFLEGFLIDEEKRDSIFKNILFYSLYEFSTKLEFDTIEEGFQYSVKTMNVTLGNFEYSFDTGMRLYEENRCKVKVGINTDTYWDYCKQSKSEFELVTLLAYLGVKSILQNNVMAKMNNQFLLSRMAGITNSTKIEDLPGNIKTWNTEYRMKKIKEELVLNWGLNHYSRYTRGFYFSSQLKLEDLIFTVEKKRRSRLVEQKKEKEKEALKKAINRINSL